jgi:large repetitive protein
VSGKSIYLRTTIASGLNHPTGLALDGAGNVYVAAGSMVYKETPAHGGYGQTEIVTDLTGLAGIAVDGSGNLYLTSSELGDVHKETLEANGSYTETAIGYGIDSPQGVAVDGRGDIFIIDVHDDELYKETLQANGSYLQTAMGLGVEEAEGLTVDGNGNVYVAETSIGRIIEFTWQTNGVFVDSIPAIGLRHPSWPAVDGQGNLYYADTAAGTVTMIDLADPPALGFAPTKVGLTSTDSPQSVTVANIGNALLVIQPVGSAIAFGFAVDGNSTCLQVFGSGPVYGLGAGTSCVYDISFVPQVSGVYLGDLVLWDNDLTTGMGFRYEGQHIALSGTGLSGDTTGTAVQLSPYPEH